MNNRIWMKKKHKKMEEQELIKQMILNQQQNNQLMLAIIDILEPKKLNPQPKERNFLGKGVKF